MNLKGETTVSKQAKTPGQEPPVQAADENRPTHESIAALAYALWEARGCPEGIPDEDWINAEKALMKESEA
jgi:hypothetical protein